jgi:glutamyl-Q tRNA(Asp) synthetase
MILAMLTCNYRGRFAPSPTGALHAGSLATALGSWLDARAHNGKWLLRIEDLDLPRCIPGAQEIIIQQLNACGLNWDETIEYQSQRTEYYQNALNQLISKKNAFACSCTRKKIEDSLHAKGIYRSRHDELIYLGFCRDKTDINEPCAWRLRVNDPKLQKDVGDFVLRRADGYFTYQLAVVVDDALQGITHVVRGADLENNTHRQVYLQKQLGLPTPQYKHLPLVLNKFQEKLSKQTKSPTIVVDTTKNVLNSLKAAGKHLGLTNPQLFNENFLTSSLWLDLAISNYKEIHGI